MAFHLFSRRTPQEQKKLNITKVPATPAFVEHLEDRTLFTTAAVQVVAIVADDRGEVQVRVNKALSANSAAAANLKKALRIFAPGPDGDLNTGDDVQIAPSSIVYDTATRTVTIRAAALPINTNYRVKFYSSGIIDTDNLHLDGEYAGTYPSGNNSPGGDFQFRTKRDSSDLPTIRLEYNVGLISVRLNKSVAPLTVTNFINNYIDTGRLDGTIIHRDGRTDNTAGPISIIQGGAYKTINGAHIATSAPVALEGGIGNARGTIAMARSNTADSATSEYFFNTDNNTFLNPTTPGADGYAAFGTITAGLDVMDKIFNATTVSAGAFPFNSIPQINGQNVILVHAAVQMKIAAI